jgi:cell division initiation protein
MIDLTPLEVRKKKGDFRRAMRGYDPALVDDFLDLVADRLDELVRQNLQLSERLTRQDQQVADYRERERALTEALVTAQEMREEIRRQTAQEAELARRSAEQEVTHLRSAAQQEVSHLRSAAQQETAQLRARVQQEVAELRTALRQEREREEEAFRVLRARQQQFVAAYRGFLEQELNELGGITRALGLAAAPAAAAAGDAPAPPVAGTPHIAPDAPTVGEVVAFEATYEEVAFEQPEPFEPEPFEPEQAGAEPMEPELQDFGMATDPVVGYDVDSAFATPPSAMVADDDAGLAPADTDAYAADLVEDEPTVEQNALDLYDVLAADDGDAGVPGPIGLGRVKYPGEEWTVPAADLAPEPIARPAGPTLSAEGGEMSGSDLLAGDNLLDEEPDEEVDLLLRNAAAAGYALEDLDSAEELLLDDELGEDEGAAGGWLPELLEDDDGNRR